MPITQEDATFVPGAWAGDVSVKLTMAFLREMPLASERKAKYGEVEQKSPAIYVAQLFYNYFRRIINRTSTTVPSYNFR